MEKKRLIKLEDLVKIWKKSIDEILFPPHLVKLLTPDKILEQYDLILPEMRKQYEEPVDILVSRILDPEAPPTDQLLMEADPIVVSMYWHRLRMAELVVHDLEAGEEVVTLSGIDDIISYLLFYKRKH